MRKERLLPLLAAVVLALDQFTKYLALSHLTVGESVPFIGNLVRWTLVFNPGGAFSFHLGNATYHLILSLIILAVLIIYIIRHRATTHVSVPLSIVAGGAIGNIIDRLRFDEVVDFIDCDFFNITIGSYHLDRWPIFNISDMALSCGIITTIVLVYFHSRKKGKEDDSLEPIDQQTHSE